VPDPSQIEAGWTYLANKCPGISFDPTARASRQLFLATIDQKAAKAKKRYETQAATWVALSADYVTLQTYDKMAAELTEREAVKEKR
jgi:hypothetical protein